MNPLNIPKEAQEIFAQQDDVFLKMLREGKVLRGNVVTPSVPAEDDVDEEDDA